MSISMIDQFCCRVVSSIVPAAVVPIDRNSTVKQILIADDHEVVRSGLRAIIETRADWMVAGEAIDGRRPERTVDEERIMVTDKRCW